MPHKGIRDSINRVPYFKSTSLYQRPDLARFTQTKFLLNEENKDNEKDDDDSDKQH